MRDVFAVLGRLARTDLTITLIGETGCGKSRLARAVHAASTRAKGPLVALDFGSASTGVAETRLLGVEQGGFPGTHSYLPGAVEEAQSGTLLIDDAAELPLALQARLLPVLESQRVRRVGGTRDIPIDVRLIVTSNRELDGEVTAGRFRQDLYFRLAAAVVRVPPLRDRREDIPLLIGELLADVGHGDVRVTPEAMAFLQARQWFGNIRELKNALACALALLDADVIEFRTLERVGFATEVSPLDQLSLAGISLDQLEKTAIKQTLVRVRGNKVRAAKMLGIAVSTLYEKLKRLSLE
jgi:two-component system response regulator HydG